MLQVPGVSGAVGSRKEKVSDVGPLTERGVVVELAVGVPSHWSPRTFATSSFAPNVTAPPEHDVQSCQHPIPGVQGPEVIVLDAYASKPPGAPPIARLNWTLLLQSS